jgi:hypothetical protein
VDEFSSRQKRPNGGRFLPEAAPPPKEGGAKKQGAFLVIVMLEGTEDDKLGYSLRFATAPS